MTLAFQAFVRGEVAGEEPDPLITLPRHHGGGGQVRHLPSAQRGGKASALPLYIPVVAGSLCGLSVLWERVSRRKELVLFLIPQVLNMLHVLTRNSHWARDLRVPRGHVLLFAVAMGVVMHAYEREPASLTPLMTGVLRFLVGGRREKRGGTEGPVKKMAVARHSSKRDVIAI